MAEPKEPLTERELEIVRLLGTGKGNKDIAAELFLSPNTVKVHLRNIFTKLEATSRTEVTMIAVRNGWIMVNHPVAVNADPGEQPAPSEIAVEPTGGAPDLTITPPPLITSPETQTEQALSIITRDAVVGVPVAPNPQIIPPIANWRRILLLASVVVLLLLVGVAVPPNVAGSSSTLNPLRIGPSQPRIGLLARGESSRWYIRSPLPVARARGVAIASGNRIFLIGGEVNQIVSPDVMLYEPVSNTWTLLNTPKPTAVANTTAVVAGNRIYFAGGTTTDGNPSNSFEAFDIATGQWSVLAPLPTPLAGHASATLGNQIYVFGGSGPAGTSAAGYRYDMGTNSWHPITPMPDPRSLMAADTVSERIYVIGGFNEGRELATCLYYVPAIDSWIACTPMTIPRSGLGLARIGANLFAIGGGSTGFIGFNERYDTITDRWTPLETPITSDWQSVAVASMPGEFFVFGGYSNGERLAFTYVYEVFTNRVYVPAFLASDGQEKKP